jgi:hypothetical protein
MKFSFLSHGLLAMALGLTGLHAQSNLKPKPIRNLAVCFLYAPTVPELYYRDINDDYQRLQVDTARFETWNVIPATTTLPLYKKVVVEGSDKPKFEVVQTWTLPPGQNNIRKLYYYNSAGRVLNIDLKTEEPLHNPLQAKVINLLESEAQVRVGNSTQVIAPNGEAVYTAASAPDERFNFQFAFRNSNGSPHLSPAKRLRFVTPTQRATILLGYMPIGSGEDGSESTSFRYEPRDMSFYEIVTKLPPAPPSPKS